MVGQGTRMENRSYVSDILVLEELGHYESFADAVFYTLLFAYIALLITNFGVLVIIIREKSLHQPMYLLFCNLTVNDILGNTVILPQLLFDMVAKNRLISYNACVSQIFFTHTFASASHTILIIMAIDRYVAICNPLRYNSIMTAKAVAVLTVSAWSFVIVLVGVLVGLTTRLSRCRSLIPNFYCDNASLFKLSCEDVSINNIYGLFYTVVLFSSSMGTVAVTYIRIGITCWTKKNAELNSKAIQTCTSHLVLYLILLLSGFIIIIMHRFPEDRFLRKLMAIIFLVIPAHLNPIIYGLQTKHLRLKILQIFKRKITQLGQ
ncbi:putative gustatory receptor clone PTE03 [Alosa sapidissima]|uniref:putative gustatory receptor clone PTE03 n=2 Tax=Alosa TaxID=34772 RepID=UPI001C09B4EA|nr:putative gustatory receptor clone PTE03 [Alosa sapidissima]